MIGRIMSARTVLRLGTSLAMALIGACSDVRAQSPLPRDDVQEWNELQLSMPLNHGTDLVLDGQFRFGQDVSRLVTKRGSAGLAFKLNKYVTVTPAYVYQSYEPLPGRKTNEHRVTLNGAVQFSLAKFMLTDNNLVERRLINSRADSTRYRNRLRIEHPVALRELKLNVFLSDEIYYDWSVNAWVRNRFYAGTGKRFGERVSAEIFYVRQNDGHVRPGDLEAFGTVFRIRL